MTVNAPTVLYGIIHMLTAQIFSFTKGVFREINFRVRDFGYLVLGYGLPYRPVGKVILPGRPGHAGIWPTYVPPGPTDSRSPCPGLNALANHGILPRDGRRITYKMCVDAVVHAYNFAPTLAEVLTDSAFWFDNGRGYVDLGDLNAQNAIQHDASFTRPDIRFWPDQSKPDPVLIDRFLSRASDGKHLSLSDMAYEAGIRRAECRLTNGQYQMNFFHSFFGDGNAAFMNTTFGGKIADLAIWLKEERFPDGWEPYCRYSFGHPMLPGELAALAIEFSINEKQRLRRNDAFITDQNDSGSGGYAPKSTSTGVEWTYSSINKRASVL
jgi:hypothetical protein